MKLLIFFCHSFKVRGLLEGRSSTFLDFLATTHLAGLDSVMLKYDVVTVEDEVEAKAMISQEGAALTPASAAQQESRHKKSGISWLDSTWAHRLALKAQKGAQMMSESFLNMTSGSSGSNGGLVDTSHTSRAAAEGNFHGKGVSVTNAVLSASYADQELSTSSNSLSATISRENTKEDKVNVDAVRSYARLMTVLLRRWLNASQGRHLFPTHTPYIYSNINSCVVEHVIICIKCIYNKKNR